MVKGVSASRMLDDDDKNWLSAKAISKENS